MIALAALAATAALAGAHTPANAVQRFILNRSPADACAQLAPAYRKQTEARYGPCLAGMRVQPKATHLTITDVHVAGANATLHAAYDASGQHLRELYDLHRFAVGWQITGAKILH